MSILNLIHDILRSRDLNFAKTELGSAEALIGAVSCGCGYLRCLIWTTADERFLTVSAYSGQTVPQGAITACWELTCRINRDFAFAKFTMDDDGEIVIRSTTMVGKEVDPEAVLMMVVAVRQAAKQYLPAYLSVIYGNEEPVAALSNAALR